MQAYKVGDTVVHWAYGTGKIVAVADKGLPGYPCSYYVIEGSHQTLWVPVEENDRGSLHLPTTRSDFKLLFNILAARERSCRTTLISARISSKKGCKKHLPRSCAWLSGILTAALKAKN